MSIELEALKIANQKLSRELEKLREKNEKLKVAQRGGKYIRNIYDNFINEDKKS